MSASDVSILVSVAGFILSVSVSMFISGARWGRVIAIMNDLQQDRVRQGDITGLRDRLSKIEGMFTLTLKDNER